MKKEEILEKSRKENNGSDEMELFALATAGKLAAQIGMIVCCIVAILQTIFTEAISFESWMIYFSIIGTIFTVKYVKLRRQHELFLAILYAVFFIFFSVMFVIRLVG